ACPAEPLTEPAPSGDPLIGGEHDAMAIGDLAKPTPVPLGRHQAAARVLYRLGEDRGDRVRALGLNRRLDLVEQAPGEISLRELAAKGVRIRDVGGRNRPWSEGCLEGFDSGQRESAEAGTVVGGAPGDRLRPS